MAVNVYLHINITDKRLNTVLNLLLLFTYRRLLTFIIVVERVRLWSLVVPVGINICTTIRGSGRLRPPKDLLAPPTTQLYHSQALDYPHYS